MNKQVVLTLDAVIKLLRSKGAGRIARAPTKQPWSAGNHARVRLSDTVRSIGGI
jgi:hypothetical protein